MLHIDSFTRAYIEAALWSSTDEDGDPLDANYSATDLAPQTLATMVEDCAKFQVELASIIATARQKLDSQGELSAADWSDWEGSVSDLELAGHDFWLTRNGHGTGFWDGDWPDDVGDALTEASKRYREVDLYVGDDGKLYS